MLRGTDKELVGHCCRRCSCGRHGACFAQPSWLTDAKVQKNPTWSVLLFHSKSFAQKPPDLGCKGLKAAFKLKKLVLPLNISLSHSQCLKENSMTFGNHNLISHRGSLSHNFQSTTNTSKPHNIIPHNSSVTLMERHSHCRTTLQHFVSPPNLFSSAA